MSLGKHIGNEELRAEIQALKDSLTDDWGNEETLDQIKNLEDVIDFCDWRDDPEYIRHDWFFGGYCEFLAVQVYGIDLDNWPLTCIDWDKAAEQLLVDYKQISILGEAYYVRS